MSHSNKNAAPCSKGVYRSAAWLAAVLIGGLGAATGAHAQADYPSKPIKMIVPQPAGGPVDVMARMVSDGLSRRLGQQVIVENRPGASGIIGASACKNAPADGYTFCALLSDSVVINPSVYTKLQYSPHDLSPVIEISKIESALIVAASLPVNSLADLARYEADHRGKLNWGHFGIGSSSHLYLEKVNASIGTQVVDVPYQGGAPAVVGLLSGQVEMAILSYSLVNQHIGQGKLRAIAALGDQPSAHFVDVPLMKDQGAGESPQAWVGVFAPNGTPGSHIAKINREANIVLQDPELIAKANGLGLKLIGGSADQLAGRVKADLATWASVAKAAKVRLD